MFPLWLFANAHWSFLDETRLSLFPTVSDADPVAATRFIPCKIDNLACHYRTPIHPRRDYRTFMPLLRALLLNECHLFFSPSLAPSNSFFFISFFCALSFLLSFSAWKTREFASESRLRFPSGEMCEAGKPGILNQKNNIHKRAMQRNTKRPCRQFFYGKHTVLRNQ